MNKHEPLPVGACILLIFLGVLFDGLKVILDAVFIGVVADPFFVTPLAAISFAIILAHYDRPMFSGKRAAAGWINLFVSMVPILDMLPDWTAYALYLTFSDRAINAVSSRM